SVREPAYSAQRVANTDTADAADVASAGLASALPASTAQGHAASTAARIGAILVNVQLLLTEQQELVHRLDALERQGDERSLRKQQSVRAHMAGHETEVRRLFAELDALTGRAN